MCNESELFLAVFTHVALQDFTAVLILNTQRTALPWACSQSIDINEHCLERLGSKSKTHAVNCSMFTVHMKFSALDMGLIIESKDFRIFLSSFLSM